MKVWKAKHKSGQHAAGVTDVLTTYLRFVRIMTEQLDARQYHFPCFIHKQGTKLTSYHSTMIMNVGGFLFKPACRVGRIRENRCASVLYAQYAQTSVHCTTLFTTYEN